MSDSVNKARRRLVKGSAAALMLGAAAVPMREASAATGLRTSVIVIGAGMAGLAAARKLAEAGLAVTIVEARNRIGGRVYTERSVDGIPMDLGAGWIHGPDPTNPITGLAAQARAADPSVITFETDDSSVHVIDGTGKDVTETQFGTAATRYRALLASARANAAALPAGTDQSLADAIPKLLARNLDIRLGQPVTGISYTDTGVTVTTTKEVFTADYAVCTATLGVLKAGSITFTPALPPEKTDAIGRLGMGQINKLFMVFDTPFWDINTQYFGYHSPVRGRYAYFLNYRKITNVTANCLVTFGFGRQGKALEEMTEAELIADVTKALKVVFGANAVAPRKIFLTRWNADPYAAGAYSFAAVNSGFDDHVALAQPVKRLLFAGEHTHEKYRATVHGAFLSGQREADRILAAQGSSTVQSDGDRLLNWAEFAYPTLFVPRGVATRQIQIGTASYNYRFYAATNSYLGIDNNNNVVYRPASGQLVTVGPMANFLPGAKTAGF